MNTDELRQLLKISGRALMTVMQAGASPTREDVLLLRDPNRPDFTMRIPADLVPFLKSGDAVNVSFGFLHIGINAPPEPPAIETPGLVDPNGRKLM
jgi:hypothetical protein